MHRLLLLAFLAPSVALGASFDCGKATTSVERLICADRDLSALDDTLSTDFSAEVGWRARGDEEVAREAARRLRESQKAWLAARNACTDVSCVKRRYQERIAELACDPHSSRANGPIGSSECSRLSLIALESELSALEERYGRKLAAPPNDPDYTKPALVEEQKAWRDYRNAHCALQGAIEGGSPAWKGAFAGICEVDETRKRLARLKKEVGAK